MNDLYKKEYLNHHDLEESGWERGRLSTETVPGSVYVSYTSPDKNLIAQVHNDGEVSIIFNRKEKKIEYIHPVTMMGMERVGATKEQLEAILRDDPW